MTIEPVQRRPWYATSPGSLTRIVGLSLGDFLIELGEQFQNDDEITITVDGCELPFAFGEPVKLDIEFEGDGEPGLEIEVELSGRIVDETPELV